VQPSFISRIVNWSVETLHHRNSKVRNCERTLWISACSSPVVTSSKSCREELEEISSFFGVSGIVTWRVEMPRNRNSRHAKWRNGEMRNGKMIEASPANLFFQSFGDRDLERQDNFSTQER
jgi:hypothetical protein